MKKTMSENKYADPIICFNAKECIYKDCTLYDVVNDMCRLEPLKELLRKGDQSPFKLDLDTPSTPKPKRDDLPPMTGGELAQELKKRGLPVDVMIADDGGRVEPKKYLGDLWVDLNEYLDPLGYEWVSAGKESHWIYKGKTEPGKRETQAPSQTSMSKKWSVGDYVDVTGPLLNSPVEKTGTRKDGTQWVLTKFTLNVDGEEIGVALWDDLSYESQGLQAGDTIALQGIRVNKPYQEQTQLGSAKNTELTVEE